MSYDIFEQTELQVAPMWLDLVCVTDTETHLDQHGDSKQRQLYKTLTTALK